MISKHPNNCLSRISTEDPFTSALADDEKIEIVDALIKVYSSFISSKIDDYNSSVYYENPNYIFECYKENKIL